MPSGSTSGTPGGVAAPVRGQGSDSTIEAATRLAVRVTTPGRRSARRRSRAPAITTTQRIRSEEAISGGGPRSTGDHAGRATGGSRSPGSTGPPGPHHSQSATSSNDIVTASSVAGRPRKNGPSSVSWVTPVVTVAMRVSTVFDWRERRARRSTSSRANRLLRPSGAGWEARSPLLT